MVEVRLHAEHRPDLQSLRRMAPPIPARNLTGGAFRNIRNLALINPAVWVARSEVSPTAIEYTACMDIALVARNFDLFLSLSTQYRSNRLRFLVKPTIEGIIADWELPDRSGKTYDRLNDIHTQGLGRYWGIFEESRRSFIDALGTKYSLLVSYGASPKIYQDFLATGVSMKTEDLRAFLNRPGMQGLSDKMIERIKRMPKINKVARMQRATGELAIGIFSKFGKRNRERCLRAVFRELLPSDQERVANEYFDFRTGGGHGEVTEHTCRINLVNEVFSAESTASKMKDGRMRYRIDYDTLKWKHFVMPFMHWTKDSDNRRTWHFDFVPIQDLHPELSETFSRRAMNSEDLDRRLNPLAGLLAVAYFSPEIVRGWPIEMGLPGSNIKQTMGPAQVPILAMMRSKELLRSEFLATLERHADSYG